MIIFKPYSHIKNFMKRYTILKIGKLHIRLHKIIGKDETTLLHNHPFNYISVILKGGYTETSLRNGRLITRTFKAPCIIRRSHKVFHRLDTVNEGTTTLFIAFGRYSWKALNMKASHENDGVHVSLMSGTLVYTKVENGIHYISHSTFKGAEEETRHSIHQVR